MDSQGRKVVVCDNGTGVSVSAELIRLARGWLVLCLAAVWDLMTACRRQMQRNRKWSDSTVFYTDYLWFTHDPWCGKSPGRVHGNHRSGLIINESALGCFAEALYMYWHDGHLHMLIDILTRSPNEHALFMKGDIYAHWYRWCMCFPVSKRKGSDDLKLTSEFVVSHLGERGSEVMRQTIETHSFIVLYYSITGYNGEVSYTQNEVVGWYTIL